MSMISIDVSDEGCDGIEVTDDVRGMTINLGSVSLELSGAQANLVWKNLNEWFGPVEEQEAPNAR